MTIRARAITWTATAALTVGALTTGCASSSSSGASGDAVDSADVTWTDYAAFQADVGPLPPEWCPQNRPHWIVEEVTEDLDQDGHWENAVGPVTINWVIECAARLDGFRWNLAALASADDVKNAVCSDTYHADEWIVWFGNQNTIVWHDNYDPDSWRSTATDIADTFNGEITSARDLCDAMVLSAGS